jgi:hypothetical protein
MRIVVAHITTVEEDTGIEAEEVEIMVVAAGTIEAVVAAGTIEADFVPL